MQPSVTPKAAGVQKGAVTLQSSIISCHSSPKTICVNVKNAENRCVCACERKRVRVCEREVAMERKNTCAIERWRISECICTCFRVCVYECVCLYVC